jgi:hypothetical protein
MNEDDRKVNDSDTILPIQFSIWDILVWTTVIACFAKLAVWVGFYCILALPVFLIPSVITHPDNSTEVKIASVTVLVIVFLSMLAGGW